MTRKHMTPDLHEALGQNSADGEEDLSSEAIAQMHLILEHVFQRSFLHLFTAINIIFVQKMALLCPLCSQSHFETLDSLRNRLVRAATQNVICPICNEVLLGLDKLTIHLFGHTLPPEDTPQPAQPSTVNMEDLTFLTSWQSEKRTAEVPPSVEKDDSLGEILSGSVFLEVKSRANVHQEHAVKQNAAMQQIVETSTNSSPKESYSEKSNPLLTNENYVKFINPHLLEKPQNRHNSTSSPMDLFSENTRADSPQEPTSPSFIFDGDTGFLLTPKQFSPEDKSPRRSSGEELSQYMAGSLRLEIQPTNKVTHPESPDKHSSLLKGNTDPLFPIDSNESSGSSNKLERCNGSLSQLSFKVTKPWRKPGQHAQELSKEQNPVRTPDEIDFNDLFKHHSRKQSSQGSEINSEFSQLQVESLESLAGMMHKKDSNRDTKEISNRDLYTCRECGKSYRMRGSLVVHTRMAHAGLGLDTPHEPRNFHCTLCSKSFKKEQQLGQHMKTHDGKQWQCETCAKFFTTKYFLKKHQRLHTGEMPYSCETCGKAFTFQQSYHKHLLYHSSDKPHECRQCGRAFKEVSTLQNHQRIHSGEKPFACETCGKCFRQRVSYIVHQRIHTGALPYQCTGCHKRFRYKVSQKSHKCTAHPPGVVVRQPGDLIQRLMQHRNILQCNP